MKFRITVTEKTVGTYTRTHEMEVVAETEYAALWRMAQHLVSVPATRIAAVRTEYVIGG